MTILTRLRALEGTRPDAPFDWRRLVGPCPRCGKRQVLTFLSELDPVTGLSPCTDDADDMPVSRDADCRCPHNRVPIGWLQEIVLAAQADGSLT